MLYKINGKSVANYQQRDIVHAQVMTLSGSASKAQIMSNPNTRYPICK